MPEGKNSLPARDISQNDHPLSRRQFLGVLAGGAGAVGAAAIGYELLRDKRTPEQIETDEGIAKLREYIGELGDSFLKQELTRYVLPIFSNPKPDFIETSEGRIPIKSRAMTYELIPETPNDPLEYNGSLTVIEDSSGKSFKAEEDKSIRFPLPYFITPNEEARYPSENKGENGTLILDVNVVKDVVLDNAISPIIDIKMLDPETHNVDQKTFRKIEKLLYLKEAFSLLFYLKYHEKASSKVKKMGLEGTLPALDSDGNKSDVDITTAVLGGADRNAGRYLALLDLAGYYLMFRVLNDTGLENLLRQDPKFADALDSIDDFRQDDGFSDPFQEATKWALTSPAASELYHQGDLNRIP